MSSSSLTASPPSLTLSSARLATLAAEAKAKELDIGFNIAVVDSATHLLSFSRMPGAKITSISIAIDKAFTAAGHRSSTGVYREAVWPGGVAFGLGHTNGGRFTTFAGGLPIKNDKGEVLGAIGVSTGLPSEDEQVAAAGKAAVEKALKKEGGKIKARL